MPHKGEQISDWLRNAVGGKSFNGILLAPKGSPTPHTKTRTPLENPALLIWKQPQSEGSGITWLTHPTT